MAEIAELLEASDGRALGLFLLVGPPRMQLSTRENGYRR